MLSAWNQSSEDVLTEEVELADGPFFCPAYQQELLLKQGRKVLSLTHFLRAEEEKTGKWVLFTRI